MAALSNARSRWSALLPAGCLFLVSVEASAVEFIPLGHLPGRSLRSEAYGISGDGRVVVGQSGGEAFRWTTEEGMIGLGDLPGGSFRSRANAASFDGSVIVGNGETDDVLSNAFRWTESEGMVALPRPSTSSTRAADVSADGTVIVGSCSGPCADPLLWEQGNGVAILPYPPGGFWDLAEATAVSADGSVVVGDAIVIPNGTPFRWTEETGSEILFETDLPRIQVHDISADGSIVVGGRAEMARVAFRWTDADGVEFLGPPAGSEMSFAWAVSADGSVLAGFTSTFYDNIPEFYDAAVWDQTNGWRDIQKILTSSGLDLSGWDLREARGISTDGRIVVGYGINPDGNSEAWMAVIPEPATLLMSAPLFAIGICVVRKTRRARW